MPSGLSMALRLVVGLSAFAPEVAFANEYPAEEMISAFVSGCGDIEDQATTSNRLSSQGWQRLTKETEVGMIAEFLDFSRTAGAMATAELGATASELEAFEKVIAGEMVYIILDEVSLDGIRISGCQLYDFEENRSIPVELMSSRIGRGPDTNLTSPEISRAEWQPGLLPAHDSFKLFFVPHDSVVSQTLHFSGLALMSDTVGVSE